MIYLSQLLGIPVIDAVGESIGTVNDLGIATGEVFPRVTSLAFQGPERTPFMISWRKYVDSFDGSEVVLRVPSTDIRFSYLQPDEVLIARDLLNKQIVDTRGMKVVRVNDLKLSDTGSTLRLLGAEVGIRGILRSLSPALERVVLRAAKVFGKSLPEQVIAWNYMDLLDRDLSDVKLSVSHKTLDELHPADIADILEQLDPRLRGQVFAQLDEAQAAEAMAELEDEELAVEIVEGMEERVASRVISEMDPDDAADLVSELGHDKAEKLLRLMGVNERRAIDQLLGYREFTAGRIMTSEFVALSSTTSAHEAVEHLRGLEEDFEEVHYIYTTSKEGYLEGLVTLNALLLAEADEPLAHIAQEANVTASPDDDQEDVAKDMNKYNLLSMPVVDEQRRLLGIVTVDDALDVLEEEHEEDLALAGGSTSGSSTDEPSHVLARVLVNELWFFVWVLGTLMTTFAAYALMRDPLQGLVASAALPICLHAADTMIRYVTGFFLEFDEEDEEAPSLLGFGLRGVGVSLVYGVLILLLVTLALNFISNTAGGPIDASDGSGAYLYYALTSLSVGTHAAVLSIFISFLSAPAYVAFLRQRDRRGVETNGTILRAVALLVAAFIFVILLSLIAFGGFSLRTASGADFVLSGVLGAILSQVR